MQRQQTIKFRTRIDGIVVAPPQRGGAAGLAPPRELVVKVRPAAHASICCRAVTVAGPPRASTGGKLRIDGPAQAAATAAARVAGDRLSGGTEATMPRSTR